MENPAPEDDRYVTRSEFEAQKKSGGSTLGCLFWGCTGSVVLVIVMAVGGFLAVRFAVDRTIDTYTAESPIEMPAIAYDEARVDSINVRLEEFREAVEEDRATESLEITSEELNILIAENNEGYGDGGKVHFSFEGDELRAQISVPFDWLLEEMPPDARIPRKLRGRYLNGDGTFDLSLRGGKLGIYLRDFEAGGKSIPDFLLNPLRQRNLADEIDFDDETERGLDKMETIEIRDGKLVLAPK